jgi:hypothetical protein
MTKKSIVGIIGVIVIILSVLFLVLKNHQLSNKSIYDVIPADAGLIIEINNYNSLRENLNNKNPLWKTINQFQVFSEIENKLHLIDSIKPNCKALQKIFENNSQILISLHTSHNDEIIPVYFLKLNNCNLYKDITHIFSNIEGCDLTERKYAGKNIADIILSGNRGKYSFTCINDIFILSTSSSLVENTIQTALSGKCSPGMDKVKTLTKSAGKSYPLNLFVKFDMLSKMGSFIIHPKFNNQLNFLKTFGSWAEFDINIKKSLILFNGFADSDNNEQSFIPVFDGQKPQHFEAFAKIPENCQEFTLLGISDLKLYIENYKLYLQKNNKLKPYEYNTDSLKFSYNIDLLHNFESIFENECGVIKTPASEDSITENSYALFRIKSTDETDQMLNSWIQSFADSTNTKIENYISELNIDSDLILKTYKLPAENIPSLLMGDLFAGASYRYCTLFDNYMLFAESPEKLNDYIISCLHNGTINTDIDFSNLGDNYSSTSNFFYYSNPSLSKKSYKNYLRSQVYNNNFKEPSKFNKINALVYQFSTSTKSVLYNNLIIKYNDTVVSKNPKAIWECRLNADILFKPTLVKNHQSNETEIFVQDSKYTIYLINNSGRILLKKNIGEPIISDIYQIDYYKNRKLQYLFNTSGKIYLMDRLGNFIENYPISLKQQASNGLTLINSKKKKDYKILIATTDLKVYEFDKKGNIESNWKFKKTESLTTQPIQLFTRNDKDYIVFNDLNNIYILNKIGESILKVKHKFPLSINNPVFIIPENCKQNFLFVATDTAGLVHLIDKNGEENVLDLGKYPANHYFEVLDMNASLKPNFIITYNNTVKIFEYSGKLLSTIQSNEKIKTKPLFYETSYLRYKIGIVEQNNANIYLYDIYGNLHKGFPLQGNKQFSIGLLNNSENKFNLIVGSKSSILLNYTVK